MVVVVVVVVAVVVVVVVVETGNFLEALTLELPPFYFFPFRKTSLECEIRPFTR